MRITLDNQILTLCESFARNSVSSNLEHYKKRKQFNKDKITKDIFQGKVGEFITYFFLLQEGKSSVSIPDTNIYTKDKKSFDADLRHGLFNIHVKTQTLESSNNFGTSWVFQKNDPIVSHSSEYDVLCGVMLLDKNIGEIKLYKKVSELTFESTKLTKFNSNKVCVYLKSNM